MKQEDFDQIKNYLEDELQYDPTSPTSMQQKLAQIPKLLQSYLTIFANQKELLSEQELKLKELHGKLYHKYKFPNKNDGLNFAFCLESQKEISEYVESNPDYIEKSLIIMKQRVQVEFLEKSLQNIKDMQWSLKYTLDSIKYYEGL
jgi:hypothetical protein